MYLKILQNLGKDELVRSLLNFAESGCERDEAEFLAALYKCGGELSLLKALSDKILYDENAFSTAAAAGKSNGYLKNAFLSDVELIFGAAEKAERQNRGKFYASGTADERLSAPLGESVNRLEGFYRQFGYGNFIRCSAFTFQSGDLRPVANAPAVQLSDLKDYEEEKRLIAANIENLLGGLPFLDMLLYGERGTGKSSTVHAMSNRYFPRGLRIVELHKNDLLALPKLKERLSGIPLKFMIYIDDLSLEDGDERFTALKAALEGSLGVTGENTMICATSNRRHIVKESFSDRKDSIHENECLQEQLSLSDRFGLTVLFSSTSKPQYLSIVKQLAGDLGLSMPEDELFRLAEQWALSRGGRSPRRARQFVDTAYSAEKRGIPVEF